MPAAPNGSEPTAVYGWESSFPRFRAESPRVIRGKLVDVIREASPEQIRAWDDSIPMLQREVGEMLTADGSAADYTAILEYELPMDSRRPDVLFLVSAGVVILELKGKLVPSQADLDQAAAYARDLRCYHRECHERSVVPILVPTRAKGDLGERGGVHVAGPDVLDSLVPRLAPPDRRAPIEAERFLSRDAYCPLPTLVEAARELFHRGDLRAIHRARAATEPAVQEISRIIHEAARTKTRRLVLLTGVPGSGKTLVGLRVVHAHFLDDLDGPRDARMGSSPAVFLSGNGPLVEVLQYELSAAGGGGKAFVRGVKDYVKHYSGRSKSIPAEYVLVFDEAQRAYDAEQVAAKHEKTPGYGGGKSEPELFIDFADRARDWRVVVGLIGSGQEIHIGEEGGLVQWRLAIEGSARRDEWQIHGPDQLHEIFAGSRVTFHPNRALDLDTELRFHAASDLHRFVAELLVGSDAGENLRIARALERDGYHLRITRDLKRAKDYLRERYAEDRAARFGLVASSRDRDLEAFGIPNGYQATKNVRFGPWYGDAEDAQGGRSCRRLEQCVTEFGAQGLELDAVLLAWGTDLCWTEKRWSSAKMRRYRNGHRVKDPHQLRLNAYRVLLTRGRDGTVVFVPPLAELDDTYAYLARSGFLELG
jgi:hypothetical protein